MRLDAESSLRDLIELAPDAFFLADLDARYTDVNRAACVLLGYSREELLSKTIFDTITVEDAERLRAAKSELLKPGAVMLQREWTLRRKDGTLVPTEISANILPDGRWQAFARDISARKQREDERQLYVSLLDASPDFIGIADPSFTPIYLNPAGRRLVGMAPELRVQDVKIEECYPEDLRGYVTDVILKTMMEEGRWEGETYFRHWQTNERIPVSDTHFVIRDPSGERVLGHATITRDISERRRAEKEREELLVRERQARGEAEAAIQQLRESEERFRLTADEAPIGMALVSTDGRFVRVNHSLCEIVGYRAEELTGLTFQDITHPDDLDKDLDLLGRLARGEVPRYELAKRYLRKDGSAVDIMLHASVVRRPDGAPRYYVAQIEDITRRKEADEERERLLRLEQRHRARLQLIRESTLEISELQTSGSEKVPEVLRSIADQARQLTGAAYGALGIGTDPQKRFDLWVFSGISAEQAAEIGPSPHPVGLLGLVAERGGSIRVERIRDHARSVGFPPHHPPMEAFLGVPIQHRGHAVGNLYLSKPPGEAPFSEEDQSVVELLASHAAIAIENARLYDQLQAAVRAREEVLSVVSHDIRNPLGAIAMREEILERTGGAHPEAHAQAVLRAVGTAQRLIDGLLDAASLDAGQLRLELDEHDVDAIIADVVDVIAPVAASREVAIHRDVPAGLRLRCDQARLSQVISNLLGNAVKFTGPKGAIAIRAERAGAELVIAVADTGTGISPDALPRVFDRYFTKGGQKGTGLGLYIARGIVEAHGGRIWVTSTPGRGSTFFVALPEQRVEQRDADARSP
jgi:PAS domain S-box-containing protein